LNRRIERVNVTLRKELSALVRTGIADPRLAPFTSITRVECAPDMGSARVYVSILGDDSECDESIDALQSAAGLLRHRLRSRVLLRRLPKLEFLLDRNLTEATDLLALIDRVAEEDGLFAEGSSEP